MSEAEQVEREASSFVCVLRRPSDGRGDKGMGKSGDGGKDGKITSQMLTEISIVVVAQEVAPMSMPVAVRREGFVARSVRKYEKDA